MADSYSLLEFTLSPRPDIPVELFGPLHLGLDWPLRIAARLVPVGLRARKTRRNAVGPREPALMPCGLEWHP
jgi:hypothetical protein